MIYAYMHLGLGDHLLCNAIVRRLSIQHDRVLIPCWLHNEPTVKFMYRDLGNIATMVVQSEEEARGFTWPHKMLKLGYGGDHNDFDASKFDREFYRQAKVSEQARWNEFKVERDPFSEMKCNVPFRFVHDDVSRGFLIDRIKQEGSPIIRPQQLPHIFMFRWMLENAEEIHCINSSFLILADSIATPCCKRFVFHRYPRPTDHPLLKKDWEIIQ